MCFFDRFRSSDEEDMRDFPCTSFLLLLLLRVFRRNFPVAEVVDSPVPVGTQESRRRGGQFILHELEIRGGDQQPRAVEHDSGGVRGLREGLRDG